MILLLSDSREDTLLSAACPATFLFCLCVAHVCRLVFPGQRA